MIQVNELRIGNLVMIGDSIEQVYDVSHNNKINLWNYPEHLNGVPLTHAILEKSGFVGSPHPTRRYMQIGETTLTMYFENGVFSIQDHDWFEMKLPLILYIHQVQNLYYSFTKTELTINL